VYGVIESAPGFKKVSKQLLKNHCLVKSCLYVKKQQWLGGDNEVKAGRLSGKL